MTDALVPVDIEALDLLPLDERVDAIGEDRPVAGGGNRRPPQCWSFAGARGFCSPKLGCGPLRVSGPRVTWSRWFGQLEGLVKVYSDCEITPSSSSAPALTGGCHGWHEAGSYPVIDDDDALWNCGNLAAGAQAWAAALAREISNGLWAPASPPSGFSATVSGRPQAGQVHIAGWDMVLGPLMR